MAFVCAALNHTLSAQTVLSMADYGAVGDAAEMGVSTTRNSPIVSRAGRAFSSADIGKWVEIFGGGPRTSPTNHSDLVAAIVRLDGTNAVLSQACGADGSGLLAICGHNNASAFQHCIDAARGKDTTIRIPGGNFLLISPEAAANFKMANEGVTHPAVTFKRGGIRLIGAPDGSTILSGCGAWQLKGRFAYRGFMFDIHGPISTPSEPLVFESLTMDGGARPGLSAHLYFPASTKDGTGWDETHDAVIITGDGKFCPLVFTNCIVKNWRGEMLKSINANGNGYALITHCSFFNGNATAFNLTFPHTISYCQFSNLVQIAEFYEAYASLPSAFSNNFATNIVQALYALNGAETGSPNPEYTIRNNVFHMMNSGNGIQISPAQNVDIISNSFVGNGSGTAIAIGTAGYQGTAANKNINIADNISSNVYYLLQVEGTGKNALYNATISNNTSRMAVSGGSGFAYGYGWGTNVLFKNNVADNMRDGLNSTLLRGQFYLDDPSNQFPPHNYFDYDGRSNSISYAWGLRQFISASRTNSTWVLDDSHPWQIPAGAVMGVTNMQAVPVTIGLSSLRYSTGDTVVLTNGASVKCRWTDNRWVVRQ